MDLPRSLLKEFAQLTSSDEKESSVDDYMRGTVKITGENKFVQLDGSEMMTPISETVDVQEGDRVIVSISSHRATIIGNLTYPPSARKEQEAIDKAEDAQQNANDAVDKAEDALLESGNSNKVAQDAITKAENAKQDAADAIASAETARKESLEALEESKSAIEKANQAVTQAGIAQDAVEDANVEIGKINQEVTNVRGDIQSAVTEIADIGARTEVIEGSYANKTELSNVETSLKREITTSLGELETTMSQEYAAKSEVVEIQGQLQSQITQNAEGLTSTATKVEELQADTEDAQNKVSEAITAAQNAQNAANGAVADAAAAQQSANDAKTAADLASEKAESARLNANEAQAIANAADKKMQDAQAELNTAKENLTAVTNRVGATEEEIAQAQAKVDEAQAGVNQALAEAAEADTAAQNAQTAANQAQSDAAIAKSAADEAQTKANNAKEIADQAQLDALKAQEDVAALTHRVTTAETKIEQNSEAITLAASKVEEIGDDLKNNYYSKTETDAKLKVESDRITSTVTKVEEVEQNAIVSTKEQFYSSTSPTELAGGSWSDIQPEWAQGKYIWRRTLVTRGDGSTYYSPSENGVCISGNTGDSAVTDGSGLDLSQGEMLYKDPSFIESQNGISLYNTETSYSEITLTRETKTSGNPILNATHELAIRATGSHTSPGWGGFYFGNQTRANAIFVYRIIAKIPEGRELAYRTEASGNNYSHKWFTSTEGTGKYTEYLLKHTCGADGTFSTAGYFYLEGGTAPSTVVPLEWNIAYATAFDMTGAADALAAYETANRAKEEAEGANAMAQSNESRIQISESEIKQLSDSISTLITDENGFSMMEQTTDGWKFNIGAIQGTLDEAASRLNDLSGKVNGVDGLINDLKDTIRDLGEKTAYIVMTTDDTGAPCIELGKAGNSFKVRITNTSVDFMEGSLKIAYVNNNSLYIERAVIKSELQIGEGTGFIWQKRQNGNLGLRWIQGG